MKRRPHLTFLEKLSQATYSELFSLWLVLNLLCTVAYFSLATVHSTHAPSGLENLDTTTRLFDSLYFSIITAVSVGYGDILPHGFSKILAMGQSTLSLLIFALLVAKLVSRRQDMTLEEVYRMTSEGIFSNIRQGLFLVRKDFDLLLHALQEQGKLTEQEWDILMTAYLQAQNLIEEIPNLYNGQGQDLYTIDAKREKLLLEAMHRTLRRMETLVDAMEKHHIEWKNHEETLQECKGLLKTLEISMPLWRERSTTPPISLFNETVAIGKRISARL